MLYTITEVAKMLKVNRNFVYKLINLDYINFPVKKTRLSEPKIKGG